MTFDEKSAHTRCTLLATVRRRGDAIREHQRQQNTKNGSKLQELRTSFKTIGDSQQRNRIAVEDNPDGPTLGVRSSPGRIAQQPTHEFVVLASQYQMPPPPTLDPR